MNAKILDNTKQLLVRHLKVTWINFTKFLWLGAVHKLCRLKGGGGGVINYQFYLVKRQLRVEEGQKSPILRRHSLWTAPNPINLCIASSIS